NHCRTSRRQERGERLPVDVFGKDCSKGGLSWLVVVTIVSRVRLRNNFLLCSRRMAEVPLLSTLLQAKKLQKLSARSARRSVILPGDHSPVNVRETFPIRSLLVDRTDSHSLLHRDVLPAGRWFFRGRVCNGSSVGSTTKRRAQVDVAVF